MKTSLDDQAVSDKAVSDQAWNDNENPAPLHRAFRWLFQDRETKKIVIAQWPNAPLWVALAAWAVRAIFHPSGPLGTIVLGVGAIALAIWAVDEIARGVCPWRRILGAGVLVGAVVAWLA